jgi:Methyltransferase TRM13./U11-48K-like CHHC zinc finger./CCCH zinc finger in TRM13 protein.
MAQDKKRRKCLKEREDQCHFFIEKKQRRCAMQRKTNQQFCSEHLMFDDGAVNKGERIPCPLDNKHTVWTKELEKHLKKCNAKPKSIQEPWFKENLNWNHQHPPSSDQNKDIDDKALYTKYIPVLRELQFKPLEFKTRHHEGLNGRMSELKNQKHAIQQSSLIANMKEYGLLNGDNFYVEFGCGKGELSRFVNTCILEDLKTDKKGEEVEKLEKLEGTEKPEKLEKLENSKETEKSEETDKLKRPEVTLKLTSPVLDQYGFGFIDRGVNRMKMDSKIIKDALELNIHPIIKRSRIDIKDLDLDEFVKDVNPQSIVGISKHLCGVATDLTLKLLLNSSVLQDQTFSGMLIAMCCRHVCDYQQLLPESRDYLIERGFKTEESFSILKRIVSWAVCGSRDEETRDDETRDETKDETSRDETSQPSRETANEHISGLDFEAREELGFIARRLIDESRVHALRQLLKDHEIHMFWYTDTDVTLENVCLCITKNG